MSASSETHPLPVMDPTFTSPTLSITLLSFSFVRFLWVRMPLLLHLCLSVSQVPLVPCWPTVPEAVVGDLGFDSRSIWYTVLKQNPHSVFWAQVLCRMPFDRDTTFPILVRAWDRYNWLLWWIGYYATKYSIFLPSMANSDIMSRLSA